VQTENSDLQGIWPGWSFWVSRHGELLCATRRRVLSDREAKRGLAPTLIADGPGDLRGQLEEQDAIERAYGDGSVHHDPAETASA
jgi:hypothetical protein